MSLHKLVRSLLGREDPAPALESHDLDPADLFLALAEALPPSLQWQWDERLGGVLAAFEASDKGRVLNAVAGQLGPGWDGASIQQAPRNVQSANKSFGGLKKDQLLFACATSGDTTLLGLWWPWSNGVTISIRFVPLAPPATREAIQSSLKAAFGLKG